MQQKEFIADEPEKKYTIFIINAARRKENL